MGKYVQSVEVGEELTVSSSQSKECDMGCYTYNNHLTSSAVNRKGFKTGTAH